MSDFFASPKRIAIAVLVLIFTWLTVAQLRDLFDSAEWDTTTAKILHSNILSSRSSSDKEESIFSVEYEFRADGRYYNNSRVDKNLWQKFDHQSDALAMASRYSSEMKVPVYYLIKNPESSYLDKKAAGRLAGRYSPFGRSERAYFGVFIITGCLWFFLLNLRSGPRRCLLRKTGIQFICPKGWSLIDVNKDGESFTANSGKIAFAFRADIEEDRTFPSHARIAKTRIDYFESNYKSAKLIVDEPITIHGLEGRFVHALVRDDTALKHICCFIRCHLGISIQAIAIADKDKMSEQKGRQVLQELVPLIQFGSKSKSSHSHLPSLKETFESSTQSFSFHVSSPDWRIRWKATEDPGRFDLLLRHNEGVVCDITSFILPKEKLPFDAICEGLLNNYHISLADRELVTLETTPGESRHFRMKRVPDENEYEYRLIVKVTERVGYFIALSSEPSNFAMQDVYEDVQRCLTITSDKVTSVQDANLTEEQSSWHAAFYQSVGRYCFEKSQFNKAVVAFGLACELCPTSTEFASWFLLALSRDAQYKNVVKFCREHEALLGNDTELQAYLPFALGRIEQKKEAMEAYARLFENGHSERSDAEDFLSLLYESERFEEAKRFLKMLIKRDDPIWAHRAYASALGKEEKHDEAVAYLGKLPASDDDERFERDLAIVHQCNLSHRFEQASKMSDDLIGAGRTAGEVYFEKGVAENGLLNMVGARRAFQLAVDTDPRNATYKSWLEHIVSELGQGDTQLIRHPIEPVELPASYIPPPELLERYEGEDVIVLESFLGLRFSYEHGTKETARKRILIQSKQGVSQLKIYPVAFDPSVRSLFINKVEVKNKDGEITYLGAIDDYYVKDGDARSGDYGKVVNIPIPSADVGSIIEIETSSEMKGSQDVFPFKSICLSQPSVGLRLSIEVSGDIAKLRHGALGDVRIEERKGKIRFSAEETPPISAEPYCPDEADWRPVVLIGEPSETWNDVATSYLELIEERLTPNESTIALAKSLTENCLTDDERYATLIAHVRNSLQYHAIAFGPRAYVPDPAAEVLKSKLSDCKGHSIALYHLMNSIGLTCELALIHSASPAWDETPTRLQFNHMINYLPDFMGGRFVDCVQKHFAATELVPEGLAQKKALIIGPDTQGLTELPAEDPNVVDLQVCRRVHCEENGTLSIHETLELCGISAAYFRSWLEQRNEHERHDLMKETLRSQNSHAELEGVEFGNVDDINKSLIVTLDFKIKNVLQSFDEKLVGNLVTIWEPTYVRTRQVSRRHSPVQLKSPFNLDCETTVTWPGGFVVETDLAESPTIDDRFFSLTCASTHTEKSLTFRHVLSQRIGIFPAEEYGSLLAAQETFLEAITPKVILTKAGA
ncbi:MAG: tetratricopeptide (TPR) repeat protein [Planctomycetota bacterium]